MWDIKTEAPREIRGEFDPIHTNVPGIDICQLFPRIAQLFATLYRNIGLNPNEVRIFDPNGRPQYLVDPGIDAMREVI
jgi:hypothetical protein